MNRRQFQRLAEERRGDASTLLDAGGWSGAYYLAGYAVECGLKACIAKRTKRFDYPDKDFANKCYTHQLERLVVLAGLADLLEESGRSNSSLDSNWIVVKDWDEGSRYRKESKAKAVALLQAVISPSDGVLAWIRNHW